jgi:GWxTD domain-containing protein
MKLLPILLLTVAIEGFGQSLTSLNFNYWYDPNHEIDFVLSPVNTGTNMLVYYQLISNRKENSVDLYSISWETRSSLGDRNSKVLTGKDSILNKSESLIQGVLKIQSPDGNSFVIAKIVNKDTDGAFYFYKPLDLLWPVSTTVTVDNKPWFRNYLSKDKNVSLGLNPEKKSFCFVYKTNFSAAIPPFAEPVRGDPFLKADSVFTIQGSFTPSAKGLYLVQEDTTSAQGLSFLVTDSAFPKYNSIETLTGPLIYISTDEEYQKLTAAKFDKAAFDGVILDITRDKDRAKNFMRSYFQKVEAANRYFSDYKDGWKTDRGMIYIIYGLPDEVSRTTTNEIWFYKTYKARFIFDKSGSVFCPEIYKLRRDSEFKGRWFAQVDLWRKSRF